MTKDEALKLALEAFEDRSSLMKWQIARDAVKEALAQPEQEPVAWSHAGAMPPEQEVMKEAAYQLAPWLSAALDDPKVCKEYKDVINAWFDAAMPAPQRTWVGLTDDEVGNLSDFAYANDEEFVRNVEKHLKEKNSG